MNNYINNKIINANAFAGSKKTALHECKSGFSEKVVDE